jgi:hypothetical protein
MLAARVTETFNRVLEPYDDLPFSDPSKRILRGVRNLWSAVPDSLDTIADTLEDLGEGIVEAYTNRSLSAAGQAEAVDKLVTKVRRKIEAASGDVQTRVRQILNDLRNATFPDRPDGDQAGQEAALAGIKSDLKMVCDPTTLEDVPDRLATRLRRALTENDALTAWLLASTRWPHDYIESRSGPGGHQQTATQGLYDAKVAEIMTSEGDPGLIAARRAYRALADAKSGVPLLELLLRQQLPQVLDELAGWRLTASSMTDASY